MGVDFVYENYAERFGDNQELEFNVQIKYQLPSCARTYQNNCPLIAHNLNQKLEASGCTAIVSKDYQAASVNLSPQESDFPINFCENDPCQCDVGLKVTKEASFVAGADDVGPEGALLATLELENSGAETAYNIEVTINLGGDSALFDLADRTRCVGNKCTIKIIENGATETMEIRVKSRETIPPTLKQITATITTSTTCYRPAPQEQVASVKVIQKWALRSNAPKQQQVTWELVGGAVIGIIVIIITFIIFWKCNCFQKVRYYDKKFEEEEEMFDDEMNLDGCEMDEVELRS